LLRLRLTSAPSPARSSSRWIGGNFYRTKTEKITSGRFIISALSPLLSEKLTINPFFISVIPQLQN